MIRSALSCRGAGIDPLHHRTETLISALATLRTAEARREGSR